MKSKLSWKLLSKTIWLIFRKTFGILKHYLPLISNCFENILQKHILRFPDLSEPEFFNSPFIATSYKSNFYKKRNFRYKYVKHMKPNHLKNTIRFIYSIHVIIYKESNCKINKYCILKLS